MSLSASFILRKVDHYSVFMRQTKKYIKKCHCRTSLSSSFINRSSWSEMILILYGDISKHKGLDINFKYWLLNIDFKCRLSNIDFPQVLTSLKSPFSNSQPISKPDFLKTRSFNEILHAVVGGSGRVRGVSTTQHWKIPCLLDRDKYGVPFDSSMRFLPQNFLLNGRTETTSHL